MHYIAEFSIIIFMKNVFDHKNKLFLLSAFTLPMVLLVVGYFFAGVFTDYSILVNDLFTQYSKFLSYYRNDMFQNGIFYSFSKDIGGNFYGIFTYYLMSPFNLFVFLFPPQHIEYAIAVIMFLKTGLAGLCATWFLIKTHTPSPTAVVFSTLYALASCFVVWHYHILWSDVFFLAPIVLLGVHNIFNKKSSRLFVISLTASLIINYYIAYMVAIFVLLYFIHDTIIRWDKKESARIFISLAKGTLLSALLSAFVTVPTVFSLLQGKLNFNSEMNLTLGARAFNPFALAPKLFSAGYDSLGTVSAPFFYCSVVVFVLTLGYFFLKNISVREKLASLFLLLSLAVSLIYGPLNMMFHMFAAPNSFPYRFVFLLVLVMIILSYKTFLNLKDIDLRFFLPTVLLMFIIMYTLTVIYPIEIALSDIALTLSLGVLSVVTLVLSRRKPMLVGIMLIIVMVDIFYNTIGLIDKNYTALGPVQSGVYAENYTRYNKSLADLEGEGYRIDWNDDLNGVNDSFNYGFNGYYNAFTSLPEENSELVRQSYVNETDINLQNLFFGVKYSLSDNTLVENAATLPLIFPVDGDILSLDNQNLERLVGNIYTMYGVENGDTDRLTTSVNENISNITQNGGVIDAVINAEKNTVALTSIVFDEGWRVWVNGVSVEPKMFANGLLYLDLFEGANNIEMRYIPKGFVPSIVISVVTLIFIVSLLVFRRRRSS